MKRIHRKLAVFLALIMLLATPVQAFGYEPPVLLDSLVGQHEITVNLDDYVSHDRIRELFPSRFYAESYGFVPFAIAVATAGVVPFSGSLTGTVLTLGVDILETLDDTWDTTVTFQLPGGVTRNIGSRRYFVHVNGVRYEAFCADPHLLGPHHATEPYIIRHASSDFLDVLRYGFPNNPTLTDPWPGGHYFSMDYAIYVTRVAVAMANWLGQGATISGDQTIIDNAQQLVNGENWRDVFYEREYLRIAVNGVEEAVGAAEVRDNNMIISEVFYLSHPHNNNPHNNAPVMFQFPPGTPPGAVIMDAYFTPIDMNTHFADGMGFRIGVPEGSDPGDVTALIVGINNPYAGQVWTVRIQDDNPGFQDIVFYIPEIWASATMTIEPLELGSLIIRKYGQSENPLAGAVFTITGPDGFEFTGTTGSNGQLLVPNLQPGEYSITEITPPPGHILADDNTQTVTIVAGETTPVTVTFINAPEENGPEPTPTPTPTPPNDEPREPRFAEPPSVRIQKIDAITRENIPGALIRLEGRSSFTLATGDGQAWTINNTGIDMSVVLTAGATLPVVPEPGENEDDWPPIEFELEDGVLTIHNIPWGYYRVQEERAPDGYSLLPAHTAFSFWVLPPDILVDTEGDGEDGDAEFIIDEYGNPISILITFENYPFGEIIVEKFDYVTGLPLDGAHFRIQGYFPEGNPGGIPTDTTGITGQDGPGRIIFRDLPAGMYTISEIYAPPGFIFDGDFRAVPVTWGQTEERGTAPVVTFYNVPMSSLEVLKIDGDNGGGLSGAVFELHDPTTGETWVGTTDGAGSLRLGQSAGGINELWPNRTYILTEIQAPPGYVLIPTPREVVLSPGDNNQVIVRNYQNPSLTIIKRDLDTGELLDGAVFDVTFENGETLPGTFTSGDDGLGTVIIPWTLFEGNAERTLIITEIIAPPGYHLADPNWQTVTMRQGEHNQVIFENRRMPTITVQKRDAVTGLPIANAEFTIEKVDEPGRGMLTGNPFRTDENGQIVLPFQHAGMYRIVETRPAPNYWLDPLEQNRSWLIEVRPNEDYLLIVENTLLPSLVITKWNHLTHRPVPLTHFRVEFEVPNSGNVIHIGDFVTNAQGQIILPFVQSGWYRVTEIRPAPGMSLNVNNSYRVFLAPGQNTYQLMQQGQLPGGFEGIAPYPASDVIPPYIPEETEPLPPSPPTNPGFDLYDIEMIYDPALAAQLSGGLSVTSGDAWLSGYGVWNWPLNSIVIKKTDITNGRMLAGATFDLIHVSTGESGTRGTVIGTFTTDYSGIIVITGLEPGAYVVEEVIPPPDYMLSLNNRQHAFLRPDGFSIVETMFSNAPFGSLLITLRCEVTGQPIQNGEFRVTTSDGTVVGTANGLFRTNQEGYILIPNLRPDSYIVTQTLPAPDGFYLGSIVVPQTVHVRPDGQTYRLEFTNRPLSTLIIRKIDSYDNSPIAGARYRVYRQDNSFVGEFLTDNQGLIEIPQLLGWFTVREIDVPHGFEFDMQTVRTVEVRPHAPTLVTFYSPRLGSLTIEGVDEFGTPLAGATFRINRQNGEYVGTYTTGASGFINIPNLTSGWYTVEPTSAPSGFIIGESGRSIEVLANTAPRTTFVFPRFSVLTIEKVCDMGHPLAGATFEVRRPNGERIFLGTTNNAGVIVVNNILPGTLIIEETRAPQGFGIVDEARTVEFEPGQNRVERFRNYRLGTLVIENIDEDFNPLQGGRFRVRRLDGEVIGDFVTPISGIITIPNLSWGAYVVEQIAPPPGFVMGETGRTVEILANQTVRTIFVNYHSPGLTIEKVCENGHPLANAEFEVRRSNGELVARGVTNQGGVFIVDELEPGTYEIVETRPPAGFAITEPSRVIEFVAGQSRTERFVNHRLPGLTIEKVDEAGNPLSGAEFEVRRLNGELVVRGVTNQGGVFIVDELEPGAYEIVETRPPAGFAVTEPSRVIEFVAGQSRTERFVNHRLPGLTIEKVDESGNPLANAEFEVRRLNGELVARGVTNQGGVFIVDELEPGAYEIVETRPPAGFAVTEPSRVIEFVAGQSRAERFVNHRLPGLTIEKVDEAGNPLSGAEFEVRRLNGELVVRGVTNQGGVFIVYELESGAFEIVETRAPAGFAITEPSRVIEFAAGQSRTERFVNYRLPSLTIEKVDDNGLPLAGAVFEIRTLTREPIAGVVFEISLPNGERIVNPATGFFDFVSDSRGIIHLPHIEDGVYWLHETRPAHGFFGLDEPILFEINSDARAREHVLVVENTPMSGLVIFKIDAVTRMPLAGVRFDVFKETTGGTQKVTIGTFTTDNSGRIHLESLEAGVYHVVEVEALPGYELDPTMHRVVVEPGRLTFLEVENRPLAGVRLRHIDAVTQNPIFNAEFMIFDSRNNVVGVFYTDNMGLIDLSAILVQGRYTIRLTRPAEGYFADDMPRTIEFVAGTVTEITWEAIPMAGQLQIQVVSGDDNQINALPAGTQLAGAIFEIFHYRTGNLVDRIISNERGMAVSRPLPLGRYFAIQVQAPQFYKLNPSELHFDIEFATQIVRTNFPNFSANLGVNIDITGPREVMPGHTDIVYNVRNIRNESTVPLADFFWRLLIPTEAVRIDRIVTGTFNVSLRYAIRGTTNFGNDFVIADNLLTTRNNTVELGAVHLGLARGEYLTEIIIMFGQVPAGFTSVINPHFYVNILSENHPMWPTLLPDGMMFAHKVDTGGRHFSEWVISNSTHATGIFAPRTIPRSGF